MQMVLGLSNAEICFGREAFTSLKDEFQFLLGAVVFVVVEWLTHVACSPTIAEKKPLGK